MPRDLNKTHLCHTGDDRMLLLGSIDDIPALGDDFLKGGVLPGALPEDVAEFLLTASDAQITAITNKAIHIDPSGEPLWTEVPRDSVAQCFVNFAERICPAFNQISGRRALLTITRDKGKLASIFPMFHFDTRDVHDDATMRAVMSVSNDGLDHETEWIGTKGLNIEDLGRLLRSKTPIEGLDPALAKHVYVSGQRELLAFKGLSIHRRNPLTDGCAHRSPTGKNDYPERGLRRITVTLDERIEWGNDFVY